MTDSDKREQRVRLRLDLEDAEFNLAHLRERAIRNAEALERIARKVRVNGDLAPSREDFDVQAELKHRLSPEDFGLLKASGDSLTALIAELRQERQKVFHLRERDVALNPASRRV